MLIANNLLHYELLGIKEAKNKILQRLLILRTDEN